MKKCGKIFLSTLLLLTLFLLSKLCLAQVGINFDGNKDGNNFYYGGNIPMPSTPTPPPNYSNSSDDSDEPAPAPASTHTHKKPTDYSWADQASSDIVNSIIAANKKKAAAEAAAALAAKKKAEAEAAALAAKKKADAQKWIELYKNDTSVVKLKSGQTKIMSLKDDNPTVPKLSSKLKPIKGLYDTSSLSQANRNKCAELLQSKANYSNQMFGTAGSAEGDFYTAQKNLLMKGEAIDFDCGQAIQSSNIADKFKSPPKDSFHPPTLSEQKIRNVYNQTRADLAKCAAEKNCSPEHIKNLNKIQLKAEQELITHYGHKAD